MSVISNFHSLLPPSPISISTSFIVFSAIVRLSESLAKMSLNDLATEQHVNEAIRLFNISTYDAVTSGVLHAERIPLLILIACV